MGQITLWNRPGRSKKRNKRRCNPRYKTGPKKGKFMSKRAAAARRVRGNGSRRGNRRRNPWIKVKPKGRKKSCSYHVSYGAIKRGIKAWRGGKKGKRGKVRLSARGAAYGNRKGPKIGIRVSAAKLKKYLKGLKRKRAKALKPKKRGKSRTGSPPKKSRSKSRSKTMAKKKGRGQKKAKAKSHRKDPKRVRAGKKAARTKKAKKLARKKAAKKAARKSKRKGGRKSGRKAARRGKRRGSRRVAIRVRRRGRRVSVTARARGRIYRGRGRKRRAVGVTFRANRRHNGFLTNWAPAIIRPYVARVEEGLSYVPGAIVGGAAANILPRFLPSWNVGWWAIGLSLVGTAIGATAASFWSSKQALAASIGGGLATATKVVALLTPPTSPIRALVGIGLGDLADYSGLSDSVELSDMMGPDDFSSYDDDVSELTDGNTGAFAAIGMDDQLEVGSFGLDDQVTLDSY